MSAPTNRWKLGAFVVGSVLVALAAGGALTARTLRIVTVTYTSYFDEAVTGLEVGSPVAFRGVTVGHVSTIDIAPDQRHVEVTYALGASKLRLLGLAGEGRGKETRISVPPDLRVQLDSTGLTGTKYLQIDFFDSRATPPPVLPFPVPENYIPSTPSMMKNLGDAVARAADRMPDMASQLNGVVVKVNALLDDVNQRGLPAQAGTTLASTQKLLATLQVKLDQLQVAELSRQATATLEGTSAAVAKLNRVLDRLDGSDGLVASVKRTSDSLTYAAGPQLEETLHETSRDLREAAVAVRQLVDALQRDPDMLLKGKAKVSP